MRRVRSFFLNALILTAVSFIMKAVGVIFNVYVSNRVGAEAMGLFALISGVYGFAVTLATSGINLAVVRLVSEALGREDGSAVKRIMRRAFIYCLFFGSLSMLLTYFLSVPIGAHLLGDERTVLSLRIFAVSLPFISLSSALHGYFTAVRKAYKNALVSMGEQLIKIFTVALLLGSFMPRGIEYACVALVLGGAISEVLSCACIAALWGIERLLHGMNTCNGRRSEDGSLLAVSLPVAFSAYARSALITLEHALIPRGLERSGASHGAALAAYGTLSGMAFPIIMFPSAIIYSFAGLLVPELAECRERKSYTQIRYIASRALQLSLIFAIGVAGILISFSSQIGEAIYPGMGVGRYIALLAPLVPVMYADGAVDAILKGLGFQVFSMNVNILDSILSVVLVALLLPRMGIRGYIVTIFVCEILNATLSMTRALTSVGIGVKIFRWIFRPIACIAGAAGITRCAIYFSRISATSPLLLTIFIVLTVLIYLLLLCATDSLTRDDIRWICEIFFKKRSENASGT